MDTQQVIILAVASFIAGFSVCKTFYAIINEYFIYNNGFVQKVGETPPDSVYPDCHDY